MASITLIRLVEVQFERTPASGNYFEANIGDVHVTTLASSTADERLTVLLAAECGLSRRPRLASGQHVVVPRHERRRLEEALETVANLVAIPDGIRRTISSPMPCVAFRGETPEAREWLASARGIHRQGELEDIRALRTPMKLTAELSASLVDRFDGVALLAEAYSNTHSLGQLREYARIFERAFALPFARLLTPLRSFLPPRYGYTEAELSDWRKLRDSGSHADVRAEVALEADARPALWRIEQAVFDVLFNKQSWRGHDSARRDVWVPTAWTKSRDGQSIALLHSAPAVLGMILDEFGVYLTDFRAVSRMPSDWWSPTVPHGTKERAFRVVSPEQLSEVANDEEVAVLRPIAEALVRSAQQSKHRDARS